LLLEVVDLGIDLLRALETHAGAGILLLGDELLDQSVILIEFFLLACFGRLVLLLLLADGLLLVDEFLEPVIRRSGLARTSAVQLGSDGVLDRVSS
jgi:hypothetical protein